MKSVEMTLLIEKLERYQEVAKNIESLIGENRLDEADELNNEITVEILNSSVFSYGAIIAFQRGNVDLAIETLEEGVKEHPFSFSLYYNLAFMNGAIQNYDEGLKNYIYAIKFSLTEEDKNVAAKGIQEIVKSAVQSGQNASTIQSKIKEYEQLIQQYDARVYPIDINGISMIRKPQQQGTMDEYMVNMYKELKYADVDLQSRMLFKSELIKGSVLKSKRTWKTTGPVVFPVSKINTNATIQFKVNGEKYKFTKEHLPINQFHYIRITEPGSIEILSDAEIFVGNPIELEPEKKPVKLVMKIFVDGLSYKFLEDNGLEEVMPYTHEFFKKGFMSTNCYPTSEWTLPSKSSINTGVYATKHRMLQPNHFFTFRKQQKLLAEYFQEDGYYCTNVSTNWRTTPSLGYQRGFNRMIYQNFLGGMDGKQVIMETIEHLMSFEQTNNFMTISLMDLHNVPDGVENHLLSQVNTDITNRIYGNKIGNTSVQTKYDKSKVAKYREEIKRIDRILSVLYDFILKNYKENEFVITLHSDHGQSFLEPEFNLLSDNRLKIPFMMRGRNISIETSDELIESVDILPSILNKCEMGSPNNIDGKLPKALGGNTEKDFTFTQVIHPNQIYKARINEKKLSYYFETNHPVKDDLTICLEDYQSFIRDNASGKDITEKNLEKKTYYDHFIFNEVKDMMRWSNES